MVPARAWAARSYGPSEQQYDIALKRLAYPRSSYILQTKVRPYEDVEEFKKVLADSVSYLMAEEGAFVDLLSFHGINRPQHIDWIMREGGCMEVVDELRKAGKVKWVGFSTHGMTPTIMKAINTGRFDYVNLHCQFIGSYTSSGSGPAAGNMEAVKAAAAQDMGVFIISPTDKGGQLYHPPKIFADACAEGGLTPIELNNLWLLSHPEVHTLVVGAARPSDFDAHLASIAKLDQAAELLPPVVGRLQQMVVDSVGADWAENWYKGLPDSCAFCPLLLVFLLVLLCFSAWP